MENISKTENRNNFYIKSEAVDKFSEKYVNYYKDINKLKNYINLNCPNFNEDFELVKNINIGNNYLFYEARNLKPNAKNKRVGIKFLIKVLLKEKKNKRNRKIVNKKKGRINNNIQENLKNINLITIYEKFELKDFSCIVMEFAKYGNIEYFQNKILQKKYFTESFLIFITKQILNGLNYCHRAKIIHMDIKSSNILIDEHLNIKINDFSSSFCYKNYFIENKEVRLPLLGTPLYMSPEKIGEIPVVEKDCNKIDIFSLGVTLYKLAYGKFPYLLDYTDKDNLKEISNKIKKNCLSFPECGSYSFLFRNFINNLLNKNINNRFSIQEALEHSWIKGFEIIKKEKEKLQNMEKFMTNILTDNIRPLNDYIKSYKPENLNNTRTSNTNDK